MDRGRLRLIVMSIVALDGLTLLLPQDRPCPLQLLLIPLLALSTFFSESLRGAETWFHLNGLNYSLGQ